MSSPSSRPPGLKYTASLREANDRLEASTVVNRKTLKASELAPTIRRQNEERAARLAASDNERPPIPDSVQQVIDAIDFVRERLIVGTMTTEDVSLLEAVLREHVAGRRNSPALRAMRAAVDNLKRTQDSSTVDRVTVVLRR